MNLASLLVDHPFADDDVLLSDEYAIATKGEAVRAVQSVRDALGAARVGPGCAVAAQIPNGVDAIITMMGVLLAERVFVPVNPRSPDAEIAHALAATRPAALLRPGGIELLARPCAYEPGVAFVTWTSGTTGLPKPVVHTHTAYLELLDRVLTPLRGAGRAGTRRPPPNLIPVSLALNAGVYNTLFGLRAGAGLVVMDRFEPRAFAELVRRHGIRSTVLPPAAIAVLADDAEVLDLSPLRYVRSITAPLSPIAARRFTGKFGVVVLNGYGQAEIGEVIGWTAADAEAHPDKVGAAGRAHRGVDIEVVDENGCAVVDGAAGELLVRPPAVSADAVNQLADRMRDDGFVRTGDVARVDGDGFVWIEGRIGDVINRGGNKVFPEQVEEVLRLAPGVREVAVVGAPDPRLGEVPVAYVVGDTPDADLEALCRQHLVAYKVPVAFRRVDALPRSPAGKVLRRDLAETP